MDSYVKNYLTSWNLASLVSTFNEEEVNEEAFKCLTEEMVKELIPKVGKRAIFMKNYNKYKETLQLDDEDEKETPKITEEKMPENLERPEIIQKSAVPEFVEETRSSKFDSSFKTHSNQDFMIKQPFIPPPVESYEIHQQLNAEIMNNEAFYQEEPLLKKIKMEQEYNEQFLSGILNGDDQEGSESNDYDGEDQSYGMLEDEQGQFSEASSSYVYAPPPLVSLNHQARELHPDLKGDDRERAVEKLRTILNDSLITRDLLNVDRLNPAQRTVMTTTIVQYLMHKNEDKRIALHQFKYYAQAIKCLYTEESVEVYYRIQVRRSGQQYTAGKLYDKYQNLRKKLGFKRNIHGKKMEEEAPAFSEKEIKLINLLKHVETALNARCLWMQTTNYRRYMTRIMSIEEYFSNFQFLRNENAHILFREEFDKLYPNHVHTFSENWPTFAEKILKHSIKTKFLSMSEITFEGFEKNIQMSSFFMLPFFFKHSKNLPKGVDWQPTKMDLLKEFILFTRDQNNLGNIVAEREAKLHALNIPVHPIIAAVGRSVAEIDYVATVVNGNFYVMRNLIEAVEICLKIYIVLSIKYRPECGFIWLFLQKFVMGLETPTNSCTSIIYNLYAELS